MGLLGSRVAGCEWEDIEGKTSSGSLEGSAVHSGRGRRDTLDEEDSVLDAERC